MDESGVTIGGGGIVDSEGGDGCFSLRADKVASLDSAKVSSEHASRTAPLKSPSSSFDDTRRRNDSIES